jgi:anti-anti-sigma factor
MQSLRELKPDVLLVALGFPQELKWIAAHHRELGVPVSMAIGNALGTLSNGRHSPPLLRKVRDYAVFAGGLLPQIWRLRLSSHRSGNREVSQPVQSEPDWRWIKLPERLDLQAINDDVLLLDQVLADGRHCLLEMSAVQFIDSTGIGRLVRLHKRIRATGKQLVLLAPSEATQRTLKLVHLHEFFAIARDEAAARALIEARTQEEAATVAAPAEGGTGTLI